MKYSCEDKVIKPENFSMINKSKLPPPKNGGNSYFYHLANFTEDMDNYKVIIAFEQAAKIWQEGFNQIEPIGNYLNIKSTRDPKKADFVFTFGSHKHEFITNKGKTKTCAFDFDGEGGVLAHAWAYNSSAGYAGTMHLDDSEDWAAMHTPGNIHLLTAVLHEWGHIWCIGHTKVKKSLMFPMYQGEMIELVKDDLKALQISIGPVKSLFAPEQLKKDKNNWFYYLKTIYKFFCR